MKGLAATFFLFLLIAGHEPPAALPIESVIEDTVATVPQAIPIPVPDTIINRIKKEEPDIKTGALNPQAVVQYAETLIGTPYLYGSIDPKKGFDCSGFITHVFNHFNVKVPRSSVEFTDVGEDVNYLTAKPGDLILFTGTDSTIRVVGHMGIVVSNENNTLHFIHSTSGKQYGVTITELSPYYMSRFVRVARVFPENASSLPYVNSARLITVDSVHHITKIKTIKSNEIDSTKNLKSTKTKQSVKKTSPILTRKKPTSVTTVKKINKKSSTAKKKSSSSTKKSTGSSSKKSVSAKKKKTSTKR